MSDPADFDNTRFPFGLPRIETDNPSVRKFQERILAELLTLLNGYEVPTYFDQLPNQPRWDERSPRQVLEPQQRIRWVFERYAEFKTKNRTLSEHAASLEKTLKLRDKELQAAIEERDKALKKIADMMLDKVEDKAKLPKLRPDRRKRSK